MLAIIEALGAFLLGADLIAGAIALTWEFWVVHRGRADALPAIFAGNGILTGPLVVMGGLVFIFWGFEFQPITTAILLLIGAELGLKTLRRAYLRSERRRQAQGIH